MDHFLFDLLRWTWEYAGARHPDWGAEPQKLIIAKRAQKGTKSTKGEKKELLQVILLRSNSLLSYSFCGLLCAFCGYTFAHAIVAARWNQSLTSNGCGRRWPPLAKRRRMGEVPIGTCIVSENKLVAVSGNRTRTDCDPTAHAEIVALREAASKLGNYRLTGVDVYSTIEPCAMCAGALIQARVSV